MKLFFTRNLEPSLAFALAAVVVERTAADLGLEARLLDAPQADESLFGIRLIGADEKPRLLEVFKAHLERDLGPSFWVQLRGEFFITVWPVKKAAEDNLEAVDLPNLEALPAIPEGSSADLAPAVPSVEPDLANVESEAKETEEKSTTRDSAPSTSLSPSVGGEVRRRGRPPGSKSKPADHEP